MKKSVLILFSGAALLALAGVAYMEVRRKRQANALASNLEQIAAAGVPLSEQKFRGFNFDTVLNTMTKQAVPEITALQHMINLWYGSQIIEVTGLFDPQTESAVKDITGKYSTSLKEFNFQYLTVKRGERAANDLITSITLTGKP